ncbi:leukotriene B4 receptor 1-like [Colossoma macropomum]|uniref:leukotriene B4 receptor 1-like n=1 Tax=Colossoma macropomum TaxID=42526 RepID=UPI001863EAAA|nr:leukotriene B4 receptor 1-like [Colossoma macropomum]
MASLALTTPISEPPNSSTTSTNALTVSHQIGIAILVLAFILGFPGNIFVVWSVLCRVQQRSVTCLLVLNLAAADAFVLLSAPFFLRLLAGGRGWEFGDVMCKTVHYLCCVNMYVSIYLICLMSLDRWLAVTRPFLSQRLRNKRTIYLAMLGIWVMAFLLALPMPFYRRIRQIREYNNMTLCLPYHFNFKGHEVFQYLFETLMGFVVPFTFILACYTSVIRRLRSAMFHGRVKGSLLILLIIITFAVFWLPYHLINILQVIGVLQDSQTLSNLVKAARPNVTAFAFLSSSVNPILYVFAGSSYIRRAGLSFMAKLFEGTHSDHSVLSRRGTSTDNSNLAKLTIKSLQSRDRVRNKSCGEEESKKMEMSCKEELKSLTTVQ